MAERVVLGIADPVLAAQVSELAAEAGGFVATEVVTEGGELAAAIRRRQAGVLVLHEGLGPLPVIEVARELSAKFPQTGIILLTREPTPDLLRSALQAGIRDVLPLPLSVETLQAAVGRAAGWSRAVREHAEAGAADQVAMRAGGTVVAVAGAKGGVGTTTTSVHLALAAVAASPERSICLVDFDLQAGDVRSMLGLPERRSVLDLIGLPGEIGAQQLEDSLYVHNSGLRVLFAPERGEDAEDVTADEARKILGALKFGHEVLVVDVGAVVTEANAVAVELADQVLLMVTPDGPALRGANRLVGLWERLEVSPSGIVAALTRTSKRLEVQPDFARRVLRPSLAKASVPADFHALEQTVNAGVPERLDEGMRAAYARLWRQVEQWPALPPADAPSSRGVARRLRVETGAVAAETVAVIPILALLLLGAWQMVLTGHSYVMAGHAAREGARSLAVGEPAGERARVELGGLAEGASVAERGDKVEVTVVVPDVLPVADAGLRVTADAGTVIEDGSPTSARGSAR